MTSTTNPRARTRTSHHVNLDVVDGPLMEAQRGARGWHRHQITALSIAYQDGELTRVETTGPRLNVDGQKHGRGESARIDWLDELPGRHTYSDAGRAGTLREDTPEWVREAVEAHPWPSTAEIVAGWTLPGIEDFEPTGDGPNGKDVAVESGHRALAVELLDRAGITRTLAAEHVVAQGIANQQANGVLVGAFEGYRSGREDARIPLRAADLTVEPVLGQDGVQLIDGDRDVVIVGSREELHEVADSIRALADDE